VHAFPEFTAERRGAPLCGFLHRRYKMARCNVLAVLTPSAEACGAVWILSAARVGSRPVAAHPPPGTARSDLRVPRQAGRFSHLSPQAIEAIQAQVDERLEEFL
jgi:hypothetical protein